MTVHFIINMMTKALIRAYFLIRSRFGVLSSSNNTNIFIIALFTSAATTTKTCAFTEIHRAMKNERMNKQTTGIGLDYSSYVFKYNC